MNTYLELEKRNLQTFGSPARREARLARFINYEKKQRLNVKKAAWRRRRMANRNKRQLQLWGIDEDYLYYDEPCEEVEVPKYVDLVYDPRPKCKAWLVIFVVIMCWAVLLMLRQNGFTDV
jgi:hypothetical protein